MASRYLDWVHRDVQPEAPRELTPKEKFFNWWDYHIWYVLAALALLAAAGYILWNALGIGRVRPDCQIAYIGADPLPEDTAAALEEALAEMGEDANGDGRVLVQLNQYPSGRGETQEERTYAYAVNLKIQADLESCESYIFLLEDPELFQLGFNALQPLDGSGRESAGAEECSVLWGECPQAAGLALEEGDQELLAGLYLARRGFWTKKTAENPGACQALWDRLTAGAGF